MTHFYLFLQWLCIYQYSSEHRRKCISLIFRIEPKTWCQWIHNTHNFWILFDITFAQKLRNFILIERLEFFFTVANAVGTEIDLALNHNKIAETKWQMNIFLVIDIFEIGLSWSRYIDLIISFEFSFSVKIIIHRELLSCAENIFHWIFFIRIKSVKWQVLKVCAKKYKFHTKSQWPWFLVTDIFSTVKPVCAWNVM